MESGSCFIFERIRDTPALWVEPYKNVLFDKYLTEIKPNHQSPPYENLNQYELACRVIKHTPRPSSVRTIAELFIRDHMITKTFAGLHLKSVDGLDPEQIGSNLEQEIKKQNSINNFEVDKIFIATPTENIEFVKQMQTFMGDTMIFHGDSLLEFLKIKHMSCSDRVMDRIFSKKISVNFSTT